MFWNQRQSGEVKFVGGTPVLHGQLFKRIYYYQIGKPRQETPGEAGIQEPPPLQSSDDPTSAVPTPAVQQLRPAPTAIHVLHLSSAAAIHALHVSAAASELLILSWNFDFSPSIFYRSFPIIFNKSVFIFNRVAFVWFFIPTRSSTVGQFVKHVSQIWRIIIFWTKSDLQTHISFHGL